MMTPDEIKKSNTRVRHFYASKKLEDNLTAILMDVKVGNFGMIEESAKAKAKKIKEIVGELIQEIVVPKKK